MYAVINGSLQSIEIQDNSLNSALPANTFLIKNYIAKFGIRNRSIKRMTIAVSVRRILSKANIGTVLIVGTN